MKMLKTPKTRAQALAQKSGTARPLLLRLFGGLLAIAPLQSPAAIVMTSGQMTQIAPPVSSDPFNNGAMLVWQENTATIDDRFDNDSPNPGSIPAAPAAYQVPLSPGSHVGNSYFVHMRPDVYSSYTASITFEHQILALYTSVAAHNATDYLGFPGTSYAPNGALETNDTWSISADGRTISLAWITNGSAFDQLRILTAPEPTRAVLLLGGLIGCLFGRRRAV